VIIMISGISIRLACVCCPIPAAVIMSHTEMGIKGQMKSNILSLFLFNAMAQIGIYKSRVADIIIADALKRKCSAISS